MLKRSLRDCALATVAIFMVVGSSAANAITLDIIKYIDGPGGVDERIVDGTTSSPSAIPGAQPNPLELPVVDPAIPAGQTVSMRASGALVTGNTITTSGVYAYLDGNGGGLGVCSGGLKQDNQCNTGSDDNVGIGNDGDAVTEILSISFDEAWSLDQLLFRDEGHNTDFYDDKNAPGAKVVLVDLGSGFEKYELEDTGGTGTFSDIGAALLATPTAGGTLLGAVGWTATEIAADFVVKLKNFNEQFYLTGIVLSDPSGATPVPLPAGIVLLLSGLAGLGAFGRFRKKVA